MARVTIVDENNQPIDPNTVTAWDGCGGMLPPGLYDFAVTNVELKQTSTGRPQIELDLTVIAGVDPVTDAYNGQTKKDWRLLGGKSAVLGRLKSLLDACGVQIAANGDFDTDELRDRQFTAEVYEDSYDKPDPATGTVKTITNTRIRGEQSLGGATEAPAAPAPAPARPAPAPAAPAAPMAPARAAAPTLPSAPRVAGAVLPRPAARPVPARR